MLRFTPKAFAENVCGKRKTEFCWCIIAHDYQKFPWKFENPVVLKQIKVTFILPASIFYKYGVNQGF